MKDKRNDLLNEKITFPRLRVVDKDGNMLGVMSSREALETAKKQKLDLFVVSPEAEIPVAKIIDYSKHLFDLKQKYKKSSKSSKKQVIKEVKMLLGIQKNDYQVKMNRAKTFLEDRDKVKFSVRLRGREMNCKDLVRDLFEKIKFDLEGLGVCDNTASSRFDGDAKRSYFLVFGPKSK